MIIDYLVRQLRDCANFNSAVQVAPAAILWTDIDKQWQSAMPFIKQQLPELIELGEYKPEDRIGPAIWIKCAIAGALEDCQLPEGKTPIIYLPGVGRKDLRAIEQCPDFCVLWLSYSIVVAGGRIIRRGEIGVCLHS